MNLPPLIITVTLYPPQFTEKQQGYICIHKMGFLNIIINDQLAFEYDRSTVFDDKQLAFIEQMDRDMDRGIRMYGELITEPDSKQKANFVAMNLLKGLQQEDNVRIEVSCAYLSSRLPHVAEVHARDLDGRVNIEFIEEH